MDIFDQKFSLHSFDKLMGVGLRKVRQLSSIMFLVMGIRLLKTHNDQSMMGGSTWRGSEGNFFFTCLFALGGKTIAVISQLVTTHSFWRLSPDLIPLCPLWAWCKFFPVIHYKQKPWCYQSFYFVISALATLRLFGLQMMTHVHYRMYSNALCT